MKTDPVWERLLLTVGLNWSVLQLLVPIPACIHVLTVSRTQKPSCLHFLEFNHPQFIQCVLSAYICYSTLSYNWQFCLCFSSHTGRHLTRLPAGSIGWMEKCRALYPSFVTSNLLSGPISSFRINIHQLAFSKYSHRWQTVNIPNKIKISTILLNGFHRSGWVQ